MTRAAAAAAAAATVARRRCCARRSRATAPCCARTLRWGRRHTRGRCSCTRGIARELPRAGARASWGSGSAAARCSCRHGSPRGTAGTAACPWTNSSDPVVARRGGSAPAAAAKVAGLRVGVAVGRVRGVAVESAAATASASGGMDLMPRRSALLGRIGSGDALTSSQVQQMRAAVAIAGRVAAAPIVVPVLPAAAMVVAAAGVGVASRKRSARSC